MTPSGSGSLSKTQVNLLGKRLRASAAASDADLDLLQDWRASHEPARLEIHRALHEFSFPVPVTITSRLKTPATIIGKLKLRTTMALSTMSDVAGARVVLRDGTRDDQDGIVDAIRAKYPAADRVDRRRQPSSGYRAVHLIVEERGRHVEIQVRTRLQHVWAELFEKLGDLFGRQIRYGQAPSDPQTVVMAGATRADLLHEFQEVSAAIDDAEQQQQRLARLLAFAPAPEELTYLIEELETSVERKLDDAADLLRAITEISL